MKRTFWFSIGVIFVLMFSVLGLVAAQDTVETDRPFLGVGIEPIEGASHIVDVVPDSAAAEAGLQVGDIITAVDGETVTAETLVSTIRSYSVGDEITLTILRDDESQDVSLTLGAAPADTTTPRIKVIQERPFLGVYLENTDEGAHIVQIASDSAAEKAGLMVDDMLVAIGDTEVGTVQEVMDALMALEPGDTVTLTVLRDGEEMQVEVTLGSSTTMMPDMDEMYGFWGDEDMPGHYGFIMPFMNGVRLGVRFITLDEQVAEEYEVDVTEGALITEVVADSPADEAGFQVGDIVTAVADDVLDVERTLSDRLYAYEPGDVVTFDVLRDGESLQLEVTLGQVEMHSDYGMPYHDFSLPDEPDLPETSELPNANA